MIRTTLAALDYAGMAAAYNRVYTGYFMPFNVDSGWVDQIIERHRIVPAHSPLWLDDDGETIGMAAIGVRGDRGWVGGFGIAPAYRGRGLSHEMAHETIEMARSAGLQKLSLEVISQNAAAIRAYERAGFTQVRDLLVLSRTDHVTVTDPPIDVIDTPADPELIAARTRMPAVHPAWQREASGLPLDDDLRALVVGPRKAPRALGFYTLSERGIGIVDIAAVDAAAARALVPALVRLAPERQLLVVNEPEDSPLVPALLDAGWTEVMRQHELAIDLA